MKTKLVMFTSLVSFSTCLLSANAFSFFQKDEPFSDLKTISANSVGPYDNYCSGYSNEKSLPNAYINVLSANIGISDKNVDPNLDVFAAEDAAKTEGIYLGQFNIIKQSYSFCGLDGAIWGYHLVKSEDIINKEKIEELKKLNTEASLEELKKIKEIKPLLYVKRQDGVEIPVYPADSILDAGRRLLGTKDSKRFPILPGEEVKCAEKKYTTSGPKYIWCSIALCVAEDRATGSNLYIQNAGNLAPKDKEDIQEFKKNLIKDIALTAMQCAVNNNVLYKEIWVSTRLAWVPKGKTGCATTIVPYLNLAKNAIPKDGTESLLQMSIVNWENALQLKPLPAYEADTDVYSTDYIDFQTREVAKTEKVKITETSDKPGNEKEWTPVQVGLFRIHFPTGEEYPNIYGLRLGLPITLDDDSTTYGIDLSAIFSATSTVKGLQTSVIGAQTDDLDGLQISIANFTKKNMDGVQFGGVNCSKETQGLQLGIVNYSENQQGIQLGLVNIIRNGWFPYSFILNFNY